MDGIGLKVLDTGHNKHYECTPVLSDMDRPTGVGERGVVVTLPKQVERFNRVALLTGWDPNSKPILEQVRAKDYEHGGRTLWVSTDSPNARVFVAWDEMMNLAVWWLTQAEAEMCEGSEIPIPEYIERQLASVQGRAGRGRLWVDGEFTEEEKAACVVDGGGRWGFRPIWAYLSEHCAGVVVRKADVRRLVAFPGTFTDMWANQLCGAGEV